MVSKATKCGIAILAAVLMLTAFAGAASAGGSGTVDDPYDADGWNGLGNTPTFASPGTIYIADSDPTHIINPKTSATISASSVTLDFSGFTGTFAGIPTATSVANKGALFGSLNLGSNTLEIKGLNMTSVTVTSSSSTVGGIIGKVSGTGALNLTNCHLKDCTVKSTGGKEVGGLVGTSDQAVTMDYCSIENCTITGKAGGTGAQYSDVGGLIGWHTSSATIRNCTVANCTEISGTGGGVGGLVGYAGGKLTTTDCSVVNCTNIKGTGNWIGGLAGVVSDNSDVTRCKVLDCTVNSTNGYDVGGLVGTAYTSTSSVNFTECTVADSTITSAKYYDVGGLLGYSDKEVTMDNCSVDNCTITGTSNVGGMVGKSLQAVTQDNCSVEKSTITGTGADIGGLVGNSIPSSVNTITVTRCKVLDCNVTSTGGYEVGGMVGQAWYSIVNFAGCMVANSTITALYSVGGLLGYAKNSVTVDTCSVVNCSIKGSGSGSNNYGVGGLVGNAGHTSGASGNMIVKDCKVLHCDVVNDGGESVGGMVGIEYVQDSSFKSSFERCIVANSTIASTTTFRVGGLLGYSNKAVTMDDCSVDNCTITGKAGGTGAQYSDVGGLIGYHTSSATIRNCTVANCPLINGTAGGVGGLVGYAGGKLTTTDCSVVNCTSILGGGKWIGGLAGAVTRDADVTRCNVLDCTVNSTGGKDVGGLVGQAYTSSVNFTECTVVNSTVRSKQHGVGGLLGFSDKAVTLANCSVENCKIESDNKDEIEYANLGGLIGHLNSTFEQTHTLTDCSVVNCSITGNYAGIGGLVGNSIPSSVNTITVTRCKVLDCTVTSTDGYEVGGMVGQAWNTIVNFAGCMVANSTITAPYSVGGLLGYAKKSVTIGNSSVVNCSIKGSEKWGVGGLVGNAGYQSGASGNMIVMDCKVLHCDVVNGGNSVGGLVGIEYGQESSFKRCIVANSTIATQQYDCGGLLGFSDKAVTLDNCSVENCVISAVGKQSISSSDFSSAGGLVGRSEGNFLSENCAVKNCVIAAKYLGASGMVGSEWATITKLKGCSVKNCTIVASDSAGGLVSRTKSATTAQTGNNTVKNCAVRGNNKWTKLICGYISDTSSIIGTANLNENFIYNNTGTDMITLCDKTGAACSVNADFWKKISYSTGQKSGSSATNVSNIGEYGKVGGYGFGSLPKYTVIYKDNGATSGTVPIDRNSPYVSPYTIDVTVTVLGNTGSLAKTGHTFGGWNTKNDGTGTTYAQGSTFTIKADTTLYAKWDSESYAVKFFMNGHGTQVDNTTVAHGFPVDEPPAPSAEGFTFNGWYKDSSLSTKYDFSTPVTAPLNLYANWTEISTYTIANASSDLNKGTTAVNKTRAKCQESVKADAFPVSGYHFTDWTCVNITGSSNNPYIFTMPDKNVSLTANFAGNITTVTYQNETDTTYDTKVYAFNESAELPNDPVKEGYTFNGWNITVGGHQYPFNGNETYFKNDRWVYPCANATDLTVQANWTANSHKVSIDTVSNGQVNAVPNGSVTEGTTVALSNASDSGYHFIRYDIYKTGEKGTKVDNSSNQFTMPGFSVNVSGIFTANVTHVGFNNGTGIQTIDNTFGTSTQMPATPTKEGFSFNGWNVSLGSGQWADFNSSSYNKNGVWNYTGTNGSSLDVHVNWTEIPTYTITNTTVNGNVTTSKKIASAGETIHVDAVADTGYHFVDWNVTNATSKIAVDAKGNFTMPASNVNAGANFTANDYEITILPAEHGDAAANKTEGCHIHDTIKLTATPHAGYMFVSWNCTDTLNFTNSTANPYQFQMNATDLVIQPIFDITSIIVEPGQVANASLEPYNDCPNEVVFCRLDNETHDILFIASSGDAGVPSSSSSGYQNMDIFATFQINREGTDTSTADIVLNVTLDGSANPDTIYLKHYNTTTNTWDAGHIAATARTDLGDNTYQYTFTTAEFSPFVVVSETKKSTPYVPSSGKQTGSTQILQETPTVTPTAEPTATPTGSPTAKPTTQPTQKSPAPLAGLAAGLGAALVIARLRR